jgi:hypothetical protein
MGRMRTAVIVLIMAGGAGVALLTLASALFEPWFRQLKGWVRWGMFGVLGAVLVTGVVLGVQLDREDEPVWADGARTWPRVPLLVRSTDEIQAYRLQLDHAMALWNLEVGCPLFAAAGEDTPDVRVIYLRQAPCNNTAVALEKGAAAGTYYCGDGTADIELRALDDIRVAYVIFAHEFGHVLGLAHDPWGLMSESVTQADLDRARPTPKDVQALRERYCLGRAQ